MHVYCTIDSKGYLVIVLTGERVGKARWWDHVLLVLAGGIPCWLELEELRIKAPQYARENIQAPGAGA